MDFVAFLLKEYTVCGKVGTYINLFILFYVMFGPEYPILCESDMLHIQ